MQRSHLPRFDGLQKSFLIFSGSNHRAIVAFCRQLQACGLNIYIIARTESDLILKTKYWRNVLAIRDQHELNPLDIARCISQAIAKANVSKFVICPTSEFFNLFLLRNRDFFADHRCEIPLVDLDKYELVSNKRSFSRLCQEHGLSIPTEYEDYDRLDFPFVAKPYKNINQDDKSLYPYLIYSEKDLADFRQNENSEDYYYEEYVFGESYYLLFYFSRDGKVFRFSQQNLLQQAGGKSIVIAHSSWVHKHAIADKFSEVLKSIGFLGLAMVEVKLFRGEFTFIELNPRFWGPSQLMVDANSSIFKAFISDYLCSSCNSSFDPTTITDARYMWLNGLLATVLAGKKLKWHMCPPRFRAWFIFRHLFHDVYLRPDTLKLFGYELCQTFRDLRLFGS